MARRNPLAALVGLAAVAGALAAVVRESRAPRRGPADEPGVVRRPLAEAEVIGLAQVRAAAGVELDTHWPGLDREDAARIAMAYPAEWAFSPRKH